MKLKRASTSFSANLQFRPLSTDDELWSWSERMNEHVRNADNPAPVLTRSASRPHMPVGSISRTGTGSVDGQALNCEG